MDNNTAFESAAVETNAATSAMELQEFVKKSQVVTITDVAADATVVEADWYICGGSEWVFICA